MRQFLSRHEIGKKDNFRWRGGGEISRIEGFSDAVFGFAVTLLVVSLEVPKTFDELMEGMSGFLGFAAAFAILFVIWTEQYKFFRRYALQDGPTLWLNALLLFIVVFFVYPLKFLFSWLFHTWAGGVNSVKLPNGTMAEIMHDGQERQLMLIYAAGYTAVFAVFLVLYWRAYTQRRHLELTAGEAFDTSSSLGQMALQMAIGATSFALALWSQPAWAGLVFCLIGPTLALHGSLRGRRWKKLLLAASENGAERT
jgi:uncharacterized membrane protein